MATATISTTVENSSSMQNVDVKRSKKKRALAFLKKLNILNPPKPKPKEGCILISEKELPKLIERKRRRRAKRSVGVNTDFENVSSNLSIGINTSNVSTLPEPDVPAKTLNSSTQCSVSSSSIYDADEDSQTFLDELTFGWTMCAAIASTFAFLLYNMFLQPPVCELLLVLSIAAHIVCCGFFWLTNCRTFPVTSGPDKDDKNDDSSKLDMDSVEQLIQETKRQTVRHVIQILDSKGLITNPTDSDVETKRSKSLGALSFEELTDLWECCSECDAYIHEPDERVQ